MAPSATVGELQWQEYIVGTVADEDIIVAVAQ
jgi:hypothetical protein